MKRCASLQERLADEGVSLVDRDTAIGEHVADCAECSAFVTSLRQVDAGMSRLSPLAPPPQLVARTADAVAGNPKASAGRSTVDPGARRLAASLAAVVVLGAGFALTESVQLELDRVERLVAQHFSVTDKLERDDLAYNVRAPETRQTAVADQPVSAMPESLAEQEAPAETALPARRSWLRPWWLLRRRSPNHRRSERNPLGRRAPNRSATTTRTGSCWVEVLTA